MTTSTASKLTFGVEIECYMPKSDYMTPGAYHRGEQIQGFPTGWNAQKDGSITNYAPSGFYGVEIVSPKLQGLDGITQVVAVLDYLNEQGAKVDSHCGLHVHVNGKNLDLAQIETLKAEFKQFEKVFFALNGSLALTRFNNTTYCKPSTLWTITEVQNGVTVPAASVDRYRSLNLVNWYTLQNKKTVEFRLFAGTTEVETAITAIFMCVALVAKVQSGHPVKAARSRKLESLVKEFVKEVLTPADFQLAPCEDFSPLTQKSALANI